jgi:hypothetical protein
MGNRMTTKARLDQLTAQEEKILRLLREERRRVIERFPMIYALAATVGFVSVLAGLNKIIDTIDFFNSYPIALVALGVFILTVTGAVYKKLG